MKIVLLGAPGAGKGTQAELLSKLLKLPKISTGDMLRSAIAEGSDLGKQVKSIMEAGQLVPDSLMIELVKTRIAQFDCQNGFLLDGFPRTLPQAEALESAAIAIDVVLNFEVDEEAIVHRISGRFVHPASGRVYHVESHPPKVPFCDDVTGEPLIQREDDKADTVRQRFRVYQSQTFPLIKYYQSHSNPPSPRLVCINAMKSVKLVTDSILEQLQQVKPFAVELSSDTFDAFVETARVVVVYFWAQWCEPCRSFRSTFDRMVERYPEVRFAKVDIEHQPDLMNDFQIRSVPTIMILKEQVAVCVQSGAMSEGALSQLVQEAVDLDMKKVHENLSSGSIG